MPDPPRLTVEDAPDPGDVQAVSDQLNAYNISATQMDDYQPLAVFARDEQGGLVGGLTGYTWGGCLKIEFLWLPAYRRGQGCGTRLLAAAEQVGRARGCQHVVLDSHSFQAPEFYVRRGYTICGVTEDFPVGHQQVHLRKRLR